MAAGQDWTTAILETIPVRKGAKAKDRAEDAESEPKQLEDEPESRDPDIDSQPSESISAESEPPSGLDS